jgi:cell division protein FtsB
MFNLQEIKDMIYNNPDMTVEEKNSVLMGSIQSRLSHLKFFLLESDWKVIVNSELVQAGLEAKYPNLHSERQAWRDEINELEEELESLGSSLEV